MHSRDLFIDNAVWLRFFDVMKDLREDGTLDDGAASVLLYSAQVHKDLAGLGAVSAHKIVTEDFVLQHLDRVRRQNEREQKQALERQLRRLESARQKGDLDQRKVLVRDLQDMRERYETALSQERSEAQESVRQLEMRDRQRDMQMAQGLAKVKDQAHEKAVWLVRLLKWSLLGVIGWLTWGYAPLIISQWEVAGPVIELAQMVLVVALGVFGWKFDPLQIWTRIRLRLEEWLIARTLRDFPMLGNISQREIS